MLYAVAVAICLHSTPVKLCNASSAVAWISDIQEAQGLAQCERQGVGEAHYRHLLDDTTYPKVFCTPGGRQIVPQVPANAG